MKNTILTIQNLKNKEKITAITAYDALFADIFDGEVDMILVGDSLSMSFGGNSDTISIDVDSMLYHSVAVSKVVKQSLLIIDMPFGSYYSKDIALKNAIKLYKNAEIDALKLEVNESKIDIVEQLIDNGIAVMAHIGLMPQFYRIEGGYKIKGKSSDEQKRLLDLAIKFQDIGCFGILLEGIKADIASTITQQLSIPTIGIGSGVGTDGQILVWSDAFGIFNKFKPKFVRQYLDGHTLIKDALKRYVSDVKNQNFPTIDESY